jgi:hypothetical protein
MVEKYLDSKDFEIIENNYGVFFAYSKSDNLGQLRYIPFSGGLVINRDLSYEIESIFGLEREYVRLVIGGWVSKKINVEINALKISVFSGSMADANLSM